MKPLSIEGLGILCACGRGIEKFECALRAGWVAPQFSADGRPAYRVNTHDLDGPGSLKEGPPGGPVFQDDRIGSARCNGR